MRVGVPPRLVEVRWSWVYGPPAPCNNHGLCDPLLQSQEARSHARGGAPDCPCSPDSLLREFPSATLRRRYGLGLCRKGLLLWLDVSHLQSSSLLPHLSDGRLDLWTLRARRDAGKSSQLPSPPFHTMTDHLRLFSNSATIFPTASTKT